MVTDPSRFRRLALLIAAALAAPWTARAQTPSPTPRVTVTDSRLAAALSRLIAGSPSADAVMDALAASGLPVAIGTPSDLTRSASVDDSESALLPDASGLASSAEPQIAWVAIRVAVPEVGGLGTIERVWVVVDADRIAQMIHEQNRPRADDRIEDDLTIALAHELVAHVGSVAGSRRVEDFCDDPVPGSGAEGRLACSLQVENAVRRELNQSLGLRGARRYVDRSSYALDAMNFARPSR